ncbi:MAG: major capsid protein, partial [Gammaproteobacteria bacterium]|nr:major capsid protein [Gammaproteobacteria bacterium]
MVLLPGYPFKFGEDTRAILLIPNMYGRTNEKKIFTGRGITTKTVRVVQNKGVLTLIPATQRGADPFLNENETRDARYIEALHFPIVDRSFAEDVQDSADWITGKKLDTMLEKVARSFENLRNKHAITHEYIRMGALKGQIVNDDGIVLVDLFTVFSVTKKTITIPLSDPKTEVREYCHNIKRHTGQNLPGDVMSHVECWCSAEFFDALVKHPTVKEAFKNYESASDRLGGDVRRDFTFGGVKFSEYEAAAPDRKGSPRKFIEKDMAHAFPTGTKDTFEIVYAPPVLNGIN